MDDLIKREDAIKWFEPYTDRGLKIPVETVIQNLKDIPSAEKQGEWIPCSERLPREYSDSRSVLATTDVDALRVIIMPARDVKNWYCKGYVSAWMPLPPAYEGE